MIRLNFIILNLLLVTFLLCSTLLSTPAKSQLKSVIKPVGKGTIDWTYGTIQVTGSGAAPAQGTAAQKKLMAQRASIADAYRQLAEIVHGVQVTSETTVKNFVVESDTIKLQVSGVIKGAVPISTRQLPDGVTETVVQMPIYGDKSLAWAIDFGNFVNKEANKDISILNNNSSYRIALLGGFDSPFWTSFKISGAIPITGLIINATGLGVEPAMCPFIIGGAKRVFPGNKIELDPEKIVKQGITHYVQDLEDAKKDIQRVGTNPLIVDAKGVKPGSDLILSQSDINNILEQNNLYRFLDNLRVCIVID